MKKFLCTIYFIFSITVIFCQSASDLNEKAMSSYKDNQQKAIQILDKALILAKNDTNLGLIAKIKNNLGIVYRDLGKFEKAKKLSQEALKNAKDSIVIATIYNNIGACNRKLGLYKEAITNYLISLKIYESNQKLKEAATINNNIAVVYTYLNLNKKSLEYYEKAKSVFEKLNNKKGISQTYNNIAIIYANQGNIENALANFRYSLQLEKKLNDKKGIAESANNVGTAHYFLGAIDSAIYYFKTSALIEKRIGNIAGISGSYNNIAQILIENKRLREAKKYLDSAFLIAKEHKTSDDIENSLLNYTDYYEALGNYKTSLNYLKKYHKVNDSIIKKSNIEKIQEIETKYQTEKKEKEIAVQKEQLLEKELEIKNKRLSSILLGFALCIMALISFFIFKRNQLKRKQLQKEIDLKDALATIKTQNRLQEQRLRISRDLHDNIGSQLTFIISSIDNLKFISKDANEKLKDKLAKISSFTSNTIYELRDTIWAMNKSEITIEDLHARILSFVEKAKNATEHISFTVNYNIDKNTSFSSLVGMNIFRVIQEAINNALKYANASKIEINLQKKIDLFEAIVKDNGDGFNIKKITLGNGLSNMEKRMSEINGKVKIASEIKKGTEILITLTLKNTSNDV